MPHSEALQFREKNQATFLSGEITIVTPQSEMLQLGKNEVTFLTGTTIR